ncbi:MAG: hypothetical protein JEY99_21260 [Spirochaetales bacterium]|nr:hypothetical protein [Spirochaetales bacterium]
MNKKISVMTILITLILISIIFTGCGKKEEPVAQTPVAKAAVSDGSEDLKISYQLNLAKEDTENFFTFAGNIRYMAVEKDHADMVSGASALGSTHLFQPYRYDVEGKNTISGGLRGTFLFGVTPYSQIVGDNFNASKASDGTITIQYAHRGTAYRIMTDASGKLSFPNGSFEQRAIGYIVGGGPQVISKDFSTDGTAATVDWTKVWDSKVAGGKLVDETSTKKTGDIGKDIAAADSMYYWDGTLDVALTGDILTINGALTAVTR